MSLLDKGLAYRCYCTPEELAAEREQARAERKAPRYSGRCRNLTPEERERLERKAGTALLDSGLPTRAIL